MIQILMTYAVAGAIFCWTQKSYPYFKAFQMGIVNFYCWVLMWNATYLVCKKSFECFETGNENACTGYIILAGVLGGIALISMIFSDLLGDDLPITQFWHDYKSVNDDKYAPRMSYSLFKKMRKLQPDYFAEIVSRYSDRLLRLEYHGIPYRMALPDYILAMLYISREERHHNTKHSDLEHKLYATMQADLNKQLDDVVKDRDAALRDIEQAARNTQDLLAQMEGECK